MPKKAEIVVDTPESKIVEINKDVKKLEKKAPKIVVESESDYEAANEFLVGVKSRLNRVLDLVEFFNKPHKAARKKALETMNENTAFFGEPIAQYQDIEAKVKHTMGQFRLAENKRIKEEEEVEAKKVEEQRQEDLKKEKEAKAKGETVPVKKMSPAPVMPVFKAPPTVKTSAGSSTAKNVIKNEILDHTILPKKYKDLILQAAFDKGITKTIIDKVVKVEGMSTSIKGVRVYEDVDISVTTKK